MLLAPGCVPTAERGSAAAFDPDSIPDAYRYSIAALMWPGATRAFQITPAGDLYDGEWVVRVRPSIEGFSKGRIARLPGGRGEIAPRPDLEPLDPAPADSPRVIAFEERWRPVAHWVRGNGTPALLESDDPG